MKVLFIKNKGISQKKIDADKKTLVSYYKSKLPEAHGINPIKFEIDEIDVDIKLAIKYLGVTTEGKRAFCTLNTKQELRKLDIVPRDKYSMVFFYYDVKGLMIPAQKKGDYIAPVTFYNGLYEETEYIEMPSSSNDFTIIHESVHAIGNILERKDIKLLDEMDKSFINGEWVAYYKNGCPLCDGGNYDITLSRFSPYFDKLDMKLSVVLRPVSPLVEYNGVKLPGDLVGNLYIPKHFKLQELVPANIYTTFGETAWQFMDSRILMNLDFIRNTLGLAVNVNGNKFNYRGFDDGGYRTNQSQHLFGRAIDFDVVGMTAEQVREWLRLNYRLLPEPNIWVEDDVTWVHMDVRYSDGLGMHLFKG